MTAENIAESLILALGSLTAHLQAENEVLAHRNPKALAPMAGEKARLTDDYARIMELVRRNPSLLQDLPADTKTRMSEAAREFNEVMFEHGRRVTNLRKVGEGVINAISEHVSRRNRPMGYGNTMQPGRKSANGAPTSIALDQSI